MTQSGVKAPHAGFIRSSGLFIFLIFLGNVCEVGFSGLTVRLPADGYETFGALFNIFFIIIAPLTSIQLVVSKEVSAYAALEEIGKVRTFVRLSFRYVLMFAGTIFCAGLAGSPLIADFLRIESVLPAALLMVTLAVYSVIPVLCGTIQGLKKFIPLGFVYFFWGFFRLAAASVVILALSGGLNTFMLGVITAVAVTELYAWLSVRQIFREPGSVVDKEEIARAYGLVLPIVATIFCVTVLKNADVIFAKRFFDPESAKAYRCAALVGSGFFTLTGIIMVMFPHVSEEKTHRRNPIVFLLKSFSVTIGLSLAGILIAWSAPDIVMKVITLGKTIPGAVTLIRVIGFAVLPVSLVYIMANYLLAKHTWGFLPYLMAGAALQICAIQVFHRTPLEMLTAIGIVNTLTCILMLVTIIREHRRYMTGSEGAAMSPTGGS